MSVFSATAPAKTNVFLKVTGRRSDGFHDLETLFITLPELSDGVEIDFDGTPFSLSCSCDDVPSGPDNLAFRAAELYCREARIPLRGRIRLTKNVPASAGFGGGSSDAAAVLNLYQERFQALTPEQLHAAAARLGSDVPFFLTGGLAVGTGRGEKLTELSAGLPPIPSLAVFPDFPVSAAWAYQHLPPESIGPLPPDHCRRLLDAWRKRDFGEMASRMINDLECAVMAKFPLLRLLKEQLLAAGAFRVMLSGSGSALIACFSEPEDRDAVRINCRSFSVTLGGNVRK